MKKGGREVVRYVTDDADADAAVGHQATETGLRTGRCVELRVLELPLVPLVLSLTMHLTTVDNSNSGS
jgi:hypothetical protein